MAIGLNEVNFLNKLLFIVKGMILCCAGVCVVPKDQSNCMCILMKGFTVHV